MNQPLYGFLFAKRSELPCHFGKSLLRKGFETRSKNDAAQFKGRLLFKFLLALVQGKPVGFELLKSGNSVSFRWHWGASFVPSIAPPNRDTACKWCL